jgi:hypothetical protein
MLKHGISEYHPFPLEALASVTNDQTKR